MKIVVIGGSGLIGTKLVERLRMHGYAAIAASPSSGVDTITGEGLAKVIMGAEVVIDVTNSPTFDDASVLNFFETSTHNILSTETITKVKHHVILSIVGADRLPDSGYMRAKVAQENLVRASHRPFTIVHATQFFEFLGAIARANTRQDRVHIPPVFVQPVAAVDVADALADVAVGAPANSTVEIAGPELFRLDLLIRQFLSVFQDPREVITDPDARYFGAQLDEMSLIPGDNPRIGSTRFEQWLDRAGGLKGMKS